MAIELSDRTFAATAALIGAATLALISDIASRSGSSEPCCFDISSFESALRGFTPTALTACLAILLPVLFIFAIPSLLRTRRFNRRADVALIDRRVLGRIGVGDSTVREDVGGHSRVDRD